MSSAVGVVPCSAEIEMRNSKCKGGLTMGQQGLDQPEETLKMFSSQFPTVLIHSFLCFTLAGSTKEHWKQD